MQQAAPVSTKHQHKHQRRKLPAHEQENRRPYTTQHRSAGSTTKTPTMQRSMQPHPPSEQRSTLTPLSINLSMLGMQTPQPQTLPLAQQSHVNGPSQQCPQQPQPPLPPQHSHPPHHQRDDAGRQTPTHARGMASPMIINTARIDITHSQRTASQHGGDLNQRRKQTSKRSGPGREAGHNNSSHGQQHRQPHQTKGGLRNLRIRLNAHDNHSDRGASEPPDGLSSDRLTEMLAWSVPPHLARDAHLDEKLCGIYANTERILRDHADYCRQAEE